MIINERDILRFLSDDADSALISNIESWKKQDEINERELALYQRIWEESSNLGSHKEFNLDEEWTALESMISDDQSEKPDHKEEAKIIPFSIRQRISAAASVILLACVCSFFLINNQETSTVTSYTYDPDAKTFGYSSLIGSSGDFELPDGSKVKLEKGSTIFFEKSFEGKDQRVVSVKGNAVIEASKNPDQPFVVNSAPAGIEVLGTIFNVISDGEKAEVENIEGLVNVFILKDPSIEQKLNPGEIAIVTDKIEFIGIEKPAPPPAGVNILGYDFIDQITSEYEGLIQPQPYSNIKNDTLFLEMDKDINYIMNQLKERTDSEVTFANGVYYIYQIKK